ncbi:MAG: dNTP triphosphohydrolase, partial [Candidatus Peregrinibacteria bacterium]
MLFTREQVEQREKQTLAPYAAFAVESRGRQYSEPEDPYRTCFQRDRDRIIHSKTFRRLKGKTQVFVAHYGDHYRSRLAHSMEVAQLSRDIARMLNLNEDLAEAIGLAHDLGHTPFGHAGQDEMDALLKEFGDRFEHNEQSRRIVEFFEEKKPDYPGLNLSFEVLDGLIKHRTTYDLPKITDTLMPSIEAQLVNVADEIAYMNHDIDDGLRSQILKVKDLQKLALWQHAEKRVRQMPFGLWVTAITSSFIMLMVNDLAENTHQLISKQGIQRLEDVYKTPEPLSAFSPSMK